LKRAINNMNAADHTWRAALRPASPCTARRRLLPQAQRLRRCLRVPADLMRLRQHRKAWAGSRYRPARRQPPARRASSRQRPAAGLRAVGQVRPPPGRTLGKALVWHQPPRGRSWLSGQAGHRSLATCPSRSPKKTGRSCLACSTPEPIRRGLARPGSRTFGIVAEDRRRAFEQ